jgi:deoxyadenosine/deoxycytidine kinase
MSEAERDQMRARLDEFSHRLDARTREFEQRGELSDLHRSLLGQIEGRHQRLQAKVAAAEAGGSTWDVVKAEFERDFSSVQDDLLLIDERLDADQMKRDRK